MHKVPFTNFFLISNKQQEKWGDNKEKGKLIQHD